MKARIGGRTTLDSLPAAYREAIEIVANQRVEERWDDLRCVIEDARICATALALNDICGFGEKRIKRVLGAISEIINGYDNQCFTAKERRVGAVDVEKSVNAMKAELADRGIVLEWD